jgi:hypothetical protein
MLGLYSSLHNRLTKNPVSLSAPKVFFAIFVSTQLGYSTPAVGPDEYENHIQGQADCLLNWGKIKLYRSARFRFNVARNDAVFSLFIWIALCYKLAIF